MASSSLAVASAFEADGPLLPHWAMSPAPTSVATGDPGGGGGFGVPGRPGVPVGDSWAPSNVTSGTPGRAIMPRAGAFRRMPPTEPKNRASPKEKPPPSDATSQ